MTEQELTILGQAVLAEVMQRLSIPRIRMAAARAGLDAGQIPGVDSRAAVVPAVQRLFTALTMDRKQIAVPILAEAVIAENAESATALTDLLTRHGYQYLNGGFIPVPGESAKAEYNAGGCSASEDPSPWTGSWPGTTIKLHWGSAALRSLSKCLASGWRSFGGAVCFQ